MFYKGAHRQNSSGHEYLQSHISFSYLATKKTKVTKKVPTRSSLFRFFRPNPTQEDNMKFEKLSENTANEKLNAVVNELSRCVCCK